MARKASSAVDFAPPRFGTERNPQRETRGARPAKIGQALGQPHMPWQRYVDDIVCEVDPATGFPWYRTVIMVVTRQEGKTTIVRDNAITGAMQRSDEFVVYTAQSRLKALERLELNFYNPLRRHLPSLLEPRRNKSMPGWVGKTGSEHISLINDSRIAIDAVKDDSGHGSTIGRAFIDEAFVHRDGTIEQGLRPAMLTRADGQMWITSAAGTRDKSLYLWEKLQLGRALVERRDPNSRIAYFEWSVPDDADRADPAVWASALPALGHTITLDTIRAEFEAMANDPDGFDRAYLGRWPGTKPKDPEIPIAAWRACAMPGHLIDDPIDYDAATPVLVIDTSPDREWTSISVTGKSTDPLARVCSRLAGYEHGVTWAPAFAEEVRARTGATTVYLAGDGAAASLQRDLEDRGFQVELISSANITIACGAHYDAVLSGDFRHVDEKEINAALAAAVKRTVSDRWRWWRGKSLGDISPLYAVALGYWAFLESRENDYDAAESVQ